MRHSLFVLLFLFSCGDLQTSRFYDEDDVVLSEDEKEVIRITNEYRESHGRSPLKPTKYYMEGSRQWSEEMARTGFRHGGTGFHGENIAYGQKTPREVMNSWINSSGHRANILNSSFTEIGIGVYRGHSAYWTQRFGR